MEGMETIKEARAKFDSYDSNEWVKAFFDECSGGFVVIEKIRVVQSEHSKNEKKKFEKEYGMCKVLARNGNTIEFLADKKGSYDIHFNGITADLKKTSSHNNVEKYAKDAIREQNAEIVIFEFENNTKEIHAKISKLVKTYNINGFYYFSENPDIILTLKK